MSRADQTAGGRAHGAVSLLNATATGTGCSLAVDAPMEATWKWSAEPGLEWTGPGDARTAHAVMAHVHATRHAPAGARATTRATMPAARGLKTSSAAAACLLQAALAALGERPGPAALAVEAVAVQRRAGTTITGAYDDTLAVTHGGARLADNLALHDLGPVPAPTPHVAVWVPEAAVDKARLRGLDLAPAVAGARSAERLLRAGDAAAALGANHAAYAPVYQHAGLPVPEAAVSAALHAGALAAGISGTGPAAAGLFASPTDLPTVPGGAWRWHRVPEGPP